jgi:C1A family cysteine protease
MPGKVSFAAPTFSAGGDARTLPAAVDLRASGYGFPPVYDQSWLESCTAGAVAAVLAYRIRRETGDPDFDLSRLFIHYNERAGSGGGPVSMRMSVEAVDRFGVCEEREWPYDPSHYKTRPPETAYRSALRHRGCEAVRLDRDLDALRACLAAGFPFVCGLWIHHSYFNPETHRTGIVPFPEPEEPRYCGHAVAIVGYDDERRQILFRNSLGESWGDGGYGYLPYRHITDARLTSVFWMVRRPSEEQTA